MTMMAMESLPQKELQELAEVKSDRCVSLYLTAPRAGKQTLESPARLRSLLGETRKRLKRMDVNWRAADRLLEPMDALVKDYPFWQHQQGGLGLFAAPDFFRACPIPYALPDEEFLGPRLHLKPLLPMSADDGKFLILALSRNDVRLYRATRQQIEPIPLDEVPLSQDEALRFDDPEKSLQVHPGQPDGRGSQTAITHGHGAAREDAKERTLRFFQRLDRGLKPYLAREGLPLLLAGVDYYLPLYRQANSYPHLINDVVSGNPDEVSEENLHRAAWPVMEPLLRKPRDEARAAVDQGLAGGQATDDLEQAVASACQGRAGTCFVSLEEHRWGAYDEATTTIQSLDATANGAVDLLDLAAIQTLVQGGDVFPVWRSEEVPGRGPLAVLRRF